MSSPNGASYVHIVYGLINGGLNGFNACFFEYLPTANALYLINDAANEVVGVLTP